MCRESNEAYRRLSQGQWAGGQLTLGDEVDSLLRALYADSPPVIWDYLRHLYAVDCNGGNGGNGDMNRNYHSGESGGNDESGDIDERYIGRLLAPGRSPRVQNTVVQHLSLIAQHGWDGYALAMCIDQSYRRIIWRNLIIMFACVVSCAVALTV